MSTGKLSSTLLLLLLFCVKYSDSVPRRIKIHVPYYVKHVHHYKKVYVPKVHVIKHEHHHKKEYDHHHHHHEVFKHGPYRIYDKSSHEYPDEYTTREVYYDDIDSKSYRGRRGRPIRYHGRHSQQFKAWKDVDGSDYSGEEEEDYSAYHKNYFFKRRSGTSEKEDDGQEDKNREEEEEEEEEDEEEVETNPSTTSVDRNGIPITTTSTPLVRPV